MKQANCPYCQSSRYRIHGYYYRSSDGEKLTRWQCNLCERTFSIATMSPCCGQNKRKINSQLAELIKAGMSQRQSARVLGVTRQTIRRKILFLKKQGLNLDG